MRDSIVLNLQKSADSFGYTRVLHVRRGDSRSLERTFTIMDADEPVDLSTKSVTFMCENAGGKVIMEPVSVADSSGTFTYRFPDAVAAYIGECGSAYFRVECDEYTGTTDDIRIKVFGDVSLNDAVTGDYVPLLDQIEEASEELAENATGILSDASIATNAANQAATEASNAASDASEAAGEASTAATAANTAAGSADAAATAANSAAGSANTAAAAASSAATAAEQVLADGIPIMSETRRGGAKLGAGLAVSDGVLSATSRIEYVTDGPDTYPVLVIN